MGVKIGDELNNNGIKVSVNQIIIDIHLIHTNETAIKMYAGNDFLYTEIDSLSDLYSVDYEIKRQWNFFSYKYKRAMCGNWSIRASGMVMGKRIIITQDNTEEQAIMISQNGILFYVDYSDLGEPADIKPTEIIKRRFDIDDFSTIAG